MQRAHEVLFYVGLGEARYRNVETYSTGMKQRIKLAQALVHDPDLLFLDEPTNGMDPKGREEMLELIRDLAHNKGVNLILSSHLLPDVEYTCDHVVRPRQGRGRATAGPIEQLKGPRGRVYEVRVKGELAAFIAALRGRRARVPGNRRGRACACSCRRSGSSPATISGASARLRWRLACRCGTCAAEPADARGRVCARGG